MAPLTAPFAIDEDLNMSFSEQTWLKAVEQSKTGQQQLPGHVLPSVSLYNGAYYMGARCRLAEPMDRALRISVEG
jgi:hypothetical protein